MVIEKIEVGGTCLNRGCIPTKTYLKNAEIIENIQHAKKRGIILKDEKYTVDMDKTVDVKNNVVKTLTNGIKGLFRSYGIDCIHGVGKVLKDKTVVVDDKKFTADKIVIATGSKVSKINIPGIESKLVLTSDDILELRQVPESLGIIGGGVVGVELAQAFNSFGSKVSKINIPGIESKLVLTSDDILELRQVPESLGIIGGGVVGVELAQAFNSFGSNVTIIEMSDRVVPSCDEEVSQVLRKSLESKGIKILTSSKLNSIEEKEGRLTLKLEGKEDVIVDKALLSIGRVPELEGTEDLGLTLERGRIKVDEYMQTNIEGVYAPGDVNGIKMLAHAAFRMGELVAENAIKGNHRKVKLASTPAAVYTMPEIGMVGLTETKAREKYDISVGKFNFAGNGRAIASDETAGFVKVIADKKYGEILGVHIIGPAAAEIINEAATLMEMEITVDEVAKTIHGHPTFSEALYEACLDVLGEAIHLPKKINK